MPDKDNNVTVTLQNVYALLKKLTLATVPCSALYNKRFTYGTYHCIAGL